MSAEVAVENVELLISGKLDDPAEGTLAARVLAWADRRATQHVPIVTVSYGPRAELELSGGV